MKKPVAVIVIPTYNEAKTVGNTIEYLCSKTLPNITDYDMQILVIDGNSPDGTAGVVRNFVKKYSNVHLLLEKSKDGIGAGYLKAFKYGIEKLKADFIFEFDSDLQHPPETIPVMLEKMSQGYDYVIGSRKIKGGSSPKGWGFNRLFLSEVGGFVARTIMFFPFKNFFRVTDPTTGLKVTRVKGFLDKLDLDYNHLYTKSFGYKLELLYETLSLGAKFTEIPLRFQVRKSDESKIEPQTAKEILKVAILLRWFDPFTQKFLKFGTVGFVGYVINAVLLQVIANSTHIEWLSWLVSTELAICSNFTLNNLWTFKSDKITGVWMLVKKFLQFNFTSIGALLIQTITGTGLVYLTHLNRQILLPFIIVFLVLPYNWIMYNKVIWKKKG